MLKISDKQLDDINKNLEKINKMNVFDKKITLNQKGLVYLAFYYQCWQVLLSQL